MTDECEQVHPGEQRAQASECDCITNATRVRVRVRERVCVNECRKRALTYTTPTRRLS